MKKILITGGYGILASNLANKLDNLGYDVYLIDKTFRDKKILNTYLNQNIKRKKINFNNKKKIFTFLKNKRFDVIFHLGAVTQVLEAYRKPFETFKSNIFGTINILESIRVLNSDAKIIFSSSDKAYGTMKKKYYKEEDKLQGEFPYDVSKSSSDLIAQSYSKTYNLSIAIIRCGNIFGPGDFNLDRLVPGTIINALSNKPIILRTSGKLRRDYIYVSDVVDAYIKTMKYMYSNKKKLHIFNIGSNFNLNAIQVTKKIYKIMKINQKSIIKNNSKIEIRAQKLNFIKAKKSLNWVQKISFEKGIKKTLNWYSKNLDLFIKKFYI